MRNLPTKLNLEMFEEEVGLLEMENRHAVYLFKRETLIDCKRKANESAKRMLERMIKQLDDEFKKIDKQD
jgi:hypothetical protein